MRGLGVGSEDPVDQCDSVVATPSVEGGAKSIGIDSKW